MKLKLTIAILLSCCASAYSQDYLIEKTIPLNDSIAFTSLRYGRKDFGFGVVNSKGVMTWQVPSPGFPVGMGKFKNNVIVFYTMENKDEKALTDIHAAIVDLKTQKIKNDKEIYSSENKYQFVPFVLDDPAGNFDFVLVRTTSLKRGLGAYATSWPQDKFKETTQLSTIYLDDNLTPQTKDIKGGVLESFFVSACAGNNNDLYVCSYNDDQLTVEKFDHDNNLKSKLSTPTSIKDHSEFVPVMQYDSIKGNCVDEAMNYKNDHRDYVLRTYRFDFNDQKAFATDENVLDKDYIKTLAKADGDRSNMSNFKSIYDLFPVQIIETDDKVIVLKEIQYTFTPHGQETEGNYRLGSLVSIYTKKDLQPVKDVVIDKYCEAFIIGATDIASSIENGKLYTLTCELSSKPVAYRTFLYTTDIDDGATQRKELETDAATKGWETHPTAACWFNNHFIAPFSEGTAFIHLKYHTHLLPVNY